MVFWVTVYIYRWGERLSPGRSMPRLELAGMEDRVNPPMLWEGKAVAELANRGCYCERAHVFRPELNTWLAVNGEVF